MYSGDDAYKGLPEKDLWKILLLGYYAQRNIEIEHDNKNQPINISIGCLCNDKRRAPTVRKHLISLGLITSPYASDDCLLPASDEVKKLLGGYSKEPLFNTSGYLKKKEHYYSTDELVPVTDLSEVYREVRDLNAYELIHVYLNQGLYDFKVFRTTFIYYNRKYGKDSSHDRYDLKIYPISALDITDGAALAANNETFAKNHAREILTAAFECRFKSISDDKEYMTKEAVAKRLVEVQDKLRILRRSRKELLVLQRKLDTMGEEALRKKLLEVSFDYISNRAPLWLNGKDSTKKELAMLICKGSTLTLEKITRHSKHTTSYIYHNQ
jgi:hypothetical protein